MKKSMIILVFLLFVTVYAAWSSRLASPFEEIGSLPVQHEGRLKPFDSVARNTLLVLHGKQSFRDGEIEKSATRWLLDVTMRPQRSVEQKVFRIDHPDVLALMKKKPGDGKYFSFEDLKPYLTEVSRQTSLAGEVEDKQRDAFQNGILQLWQQVTLYLEMSNTLHLAQNPDLTSEIAAIKLGEADMRGAFIERYNFLSQLAKFQPLPPKQSEGEWLSIGEGLLISVEKDEVDPNLESFARLIDAYQQNNINLFRKTLASYREGVQEDFSFVLQKAKLEVLFNATQPFFVSITFYLFAFLLGIVSWIFSPKKLASLAFTFLIAAFFIHSLGLLTRMFLEGRPPVTNLYSSAIFVGWVAVLLTIVLERFFRNSFSTVVGSIVASLTLIVAHHLAGRGDTMEMMQAVLNSNFWLSTHVVSITIGYSATFLAGFFGTVYVFFRLLKSKIPQRQERTLGQMVYGIICFATLFSFVGTILGGIWADQSWGRFWGWDPKENGALLIVLWNAFILHARWAGWVQTRGIMLLAIIGNIITSFSWFGVNMLGVGLHSYGFMDSAFFWLLAFIAAQISFLFLGLLPKQHKSL